MRGVEVDIFLPEQSDLPHLHWAAFAQLWQVLEHGCRVWMSPGPFDHSKLMVVDGAWTLLGSANWDTRSLRLNFEFNVECYDTELGKQLETLAYARRAAGRELTLAEVNARPLPIKLRDGRWWRGSTWHTITQGMPRWVVHQMEIWKELIEKLEKRIAQEEKKLRHVEAAEPVLFGEGELTHVMLKRELLNLQRFRNARQLGNYFGLCPSESTSGERRRLGAITKHGNPRLRRMMVELAWRIVRFQPDYVALQRWGPVLQDKSRSAAARKKAIVAVARRLAIDLWRIALGRKKAQELGLRLSVRA
jgi:hypothetical protein